MGETLYFICQQEVTKMVSFPHLRQMTVCVETKTKQTSLTEPVHPKQNKTIQPAKTKQDK